MGLYGVKTHEEDDVQKNTITCKRNRDELKVGVVILANRQTSNTTELEQIRGNERAMDGAFKDEELKNLMDLVYFHLKYRLKNYLTGPIEIKENVE